LEQSKVAFNTSNQESFEISIFVLFNFIFFVILDWGVRAVRFLLFRIRRARCDGRCGLFLLLLLWLLLLWLLLLLFGVVAALNLLFRLLVRSCVVGGLLLDGGLCFFRT
jgi:hypothetical protein